MITALCTLFQQEYTLYLVLCGVGLLGFTTGALGVFALLRGSTLLGDAISHAALPGIAIAFLITYSKDPYFLLAGGAISGLLGALFVRVINYYTTLKQDAALGIVLSVFFGFGLVLLSIIQQLPVAQQGILNKFLFGNASTLLFSDLYYIIGVSLLVFGILVACWHRFLVVTFDAAFASSIGIYTRSIDVWLTGLFVLAIVIGLQTIGVILMSSFFIAPAAAAAQWTKQIVPMIFLAGLLGAFASCLGAVMSSMFVHVPTGPTIVVIMSCIVVISLIKSQWCAGA